MERKYTANIVLLMKMNGAKLDFSNAAINGRNITSVSNMDKQGFTVFCSDYSFCPSLHSFVFDASSAVGVASKDYTNDGAIVVTIGIAGITNASEIARAFYEGVKTAVALEPSTLSNYPISSDNTVTIPSGSGRNSPNAGDRLYFRDNGDGTYSMRRNYAIWIYEGYPGTPPPPPLPPVPVPTPVPVVVTDTEYNPLKIHHGTQANQATNFYINDMHTKSLGTGKLISGGLPINESDLARYDALSYDDDLQAAWLDTLKLAQNKTLDDIDVITKQNANVAIRVIDGAIDYALNEATTMGAYLQRLDYTDMNITTMNENVQGAESTIRDADMAKEMTDYTKFNVLQQAAQSMLAQANQNASSVLILLQ